MDRIDRQILDLLQQDAERPMAEIAETVGLSKTPCWRRIKALEAAGYIRRRVALLDRDRLNLGVTAFVAIRAARHDADWLKRFHEAVAPMPEVTEFYRMSGDIDYLLRVVAPDLQDFSDVVLKRLLTLPAVATVRSSLSLGEVKETDTLPLPG